MQIPGQLLHLTTTSNCFEQSHDPRLLGRTLFQGNGYHETGPLAAGIAGRLSAGDTVILGSQTRASRSPAELLRQ